MERDSIFFPWFAMVVAFFNVLENTFNVFFIDYCIQKKNKKNTSDGGQWNGKNLNILYKRVNCASKQVQQHANYSFCIMTWVVRMDLSKTICGDYGYPNPYGMVIRLVLGDSLYLWNM